MTCRRKTKKERELVADLHKTFGIFCKKNNSCLNCKYIKSPNCFKSYVNDLLEKEE